MQDRRTKDEEKKIPEVPFSEGLTVLDGGRPLSEKPCCGSCAEGKECQGGKVLNG